MERYNQLARQLGQELLADGGLLRLRVSGASMEPTLLAGDVIWVEPAAADELAPGDLVLARRAEDMVTHRLISAGEGEWILKGDACFFPDPPLPAAALIGRVVLLERSGQKMRFDAVEVKAASRRILRLSRLESRIYRLAQRISGAVFGEKTPEWLKRLGRLAAAPFRQIIRIM